MQISKSILCSLVFYLGSSFIIIQAQSLQGTWILENFELDLSQSLLSVSSNNILEGEIQMMSKRMQGQITLYLQNDGTFINSGSSPKQSKQESKGTWRVSQDTLYLHPEHHLETGSHFSQQNQLLKIHIPSVDQNQVKTFAIFRKVE